MSILSQGLQGEPAMAIVYIMVARLYQAELARSLGRSVGCFSLACSGMDLTQLAKAH